MFGRPMSDGWTSTEEAPAGYRLGDPIALHDFLALPPDGRRYTRDRRGRLALMPPDDPLRHRRPLGALARQLYRAPLDDASWELLPEPGVAFSPIYSLRTRRPLPRSRIGRKSLIPDFAVFAGRAQVVAHSATGGLVFAPTGLRLVIEVLSKDTHREDLGLGRADRDDRWRTYLASDVPEYWILNAGLERGVIPPRSALCLRRDGQRWVTLDAPGPLHPTAEVHGLRPLVGGSVASSAVPGLAVDLDALWRGVTGSTP